MTLTYYPTRGNDEVINELGHYAAYYCNFCPGSGTPWDFLPAMGWEVIKCNTVATGSHGCCSNCVVIYVELNQIIPPCIPDWQCNQPLDGTMSDGCGNTQSNSECDMISEPPVSVSTDRNESYVKPVLYGIIGLAILSAIVSKED